MGESANGGRGDPCKRRSRRTFTRDGDAARSGDEANRKHRLCAALDRNGTRRSCKYLQPTGKSAELEGIPRGSKKCVGAGTECGVRGCGRKHRLCDGRASTHSEKRTRGGSSPGRHRPV